MTRIPPNNNNNNYHKQVQIMADLFKTHLANSKVRRPKVV